MTDDEIDDRLTAILTRHHRDISDTGGKPTAGYLDDMRGLIAAQAENAVEAARREAQPVRRERRKPA